MKKTEHFCISILTNLTIDLGGIYYAVEICWSDEPHTRLILMCSYPGKDSQLRCSNEKKVNE